MTELRLEQIDMTYGATPVLSGVSLEVERGELLVLVGPSGCGKSTLLRIIAGLIEPTGGLVRLDGEVVNGVGPRARDVALVFQNYALYPHRTVRGNLSFPLEMRRVPKREIAARVAATASTLGLAALLDRRPAELSGGQMQRVALGRAIIRNPRLFLFDEPLSNLDAQLRAEMREEIARLHRRLGVTTVYVTHDQAEAMTLGSRIAVLNGGRLEQVGPPLDVHRAPASTFVASFIGSPAMSLLRGRVTDGVFHAGRLVLGPAPFADGDGVLGVRPHDVVLRGPHRATVELSERLGSQTHATCDLGAGQRLRLSIEGDRAIASGDEIEFDVPEGARRWFDATTGRALT